MNTESNTPRTDAVECRADEMVSSAFVVDAYFARQLENELNEAKERIKQLENK